MANIARPSGQSRADSSAVVHGRPGSDAAEACYVLRLYVCGITPRSTMAIDNIRQICQQHLGGRHDLTIIDIYQQPAAAKNEQIVAAPTLVKEQPLPQRRVIGSMADQGRVLVALGIAVGAAG